MENKTVWVVSKGEYSDRYIVAIASTKERAEEIATAHTGYCDYCDLEEYELDADRDYLTSVDLKVWDVTRRHSDGDITVRYGSPLDISYPKYPNVINNVIEGEECLRVLVIAEHREQAIKKASDIFAKYRAEKLGL